VIDEDKRSGLNVALNESALLSVQVDSSQWTAIVWLSALTLDDHGDQPKDATFGLLLTGVTRVAASLRDGRWDDEAAAVRELRLDQLDESIREFGGTPIYGWEFIDPPEASWAHWRERLSLDALFSDIPAHHVVELFQEGATVDRHLDLRIWFTDLEIRDRAGQGIPVDAFIAGGVRWWDALYAGDRTTDGHGIVALRSERVTAPPPGDRSTLWQRLARPWKRSR